MTDHAPMDLPYWLVNVPPEQWPAEGIDAPCPIWLQDLGSRVESHLAIPDSDYALLSWPETRKIIGENQLQLLSRVPSELRRYFHFIYELKINWGSVLEFVRRQRVKWDDLTPICPIPFGNSADLRILYNDWPYGLDPKIKHLVVWVKFAFEEDPTTGDLTDGCRAQIQRYVDGTFGSGEDVLWFRNWSAIKSVHAIEHFHVLLHDADPDFLRRLTNGDVPMHDLDDASLAEILQSHA